MSKADNNDRPVPETLTAPIVIDFHLPEGVDALNTYRQAQHLVAGIDPRSTPADLVERIMNAYQEAAHELANHVSAAVRIQRGEVGFSNEVHEAPSDEQL
ncbi:hypothetical protein ACF8FF_07155 [Pseudomonas sp. zjy_13]|uniref:hypothetical protein n=1 Tax=Pseudomonas sp. zjy_13 TaxID=3367263 RepID=UPI00370ACF23